MATCYRHPSRETGVSCSSCGRPICTDCMTSTPVGMRCPECASQRTKVVRLRETHTGPVVTHALIAINVIVFLAEGGGALTFSGSSSGSLYIKGALIGSLFGKGVAYGEWWRIVTSGFLHENILHIGFNMWVLYYLGTLLEPALGRLRFGLIYAVSLLCGSLGALLVSPHAVTVGASGAIFGLMGAAAVEMNARQIPIFQSGVGGLIVLNLIISFSIPGISWGGHIGGLVGGTVAAFVLRFGQVHRNQVLALLGCAAIGVAAFAGSIMTAHSSKPESLEVGVAAPLSSEP
ncbi:MAG TPA: rhomboid family intramembrane serine protease [Solirubrobacteraceae bacterium]|nr:rhomboid family intramembrane serine protease [Solirubrobacteraceae bacterium]